MNRFFSIASSALITTGLAILPVASFAQVTMPGGNDPAKAPATQIAPAASAAIPTPATAMPTTAMPATAMPATSAGKTTTAPVVAAKPATVTSADKSAKADAKAPLPGAKTEQHSQAKSAKVHHVSVKAKSTVPAVAKS